MSAEEISLQNGLSVLQDDPIRAFNCGPPTTTARTGPKTTRELTGFIDDKLFSFTSSQTPEFRPSSIYAAASTDRRDLPNHHHRNWGNTTVGGSAISGEDESDGDDVDEEDEDEDGDADDDDGGDGDENNNRNIDINNHNNRNNSGNETVNNAGNGNPEKTGNGKAKHSFVGGSCRELVVKGGGNSVGQGLRESNNYQNAVTIADPDGDIYYTQYLQGEGTGGSGGSNGQKDIVVENGGGYGFSGRKDVSFSSESGDSLRAILSDPVT